MTRRVDSPPVPWLPEGTAPPGLIVCEQRGRWALVLRGHWDSSWARLHETRSLAECWEQLRRKPASFVIVEVGRNNVEALLERMIRLERECPLARLAVVADRELAGFEWPLREAGAVHFVTSPREAASLAEVARRHLARLPRPKQTFAERVWAQLPWGAAAK